LLSPGYSILDESAQFALLRRAQDLWAEQQDDKILEIIIRARLSEDVDALWSWYEEQEKALGHMWLSEFDPSRHYLFCMLAYRLGNENLFEKQAASWRASVQDRHSESSYSTRILALMRSSLSDPDSAAERWALLADDLDESNQQWREGDLARRLDLPGWIKSLSLVQS
jgi:siderophore synthetase component